MPKDLIHHVLHKEKTDKINFFVIRNYSGLDNYVCVCFNLKRFYKITYYKEKYNKYLSSHYPMF